MFDKKNPNMIARANGTQYTGTAIDIAHWMSLNGLCDGDITIMVDGVEINRAELADTDDVEEVATLIRRILELD